MLDIDKPTLDACHFLTNHRTESCKLYNVNLNNIFQEHVLNLPCCSALTIKILWFRKQVHFLFPLCYLAGWKSPQPMQRVVDRCTGCLFGCVIAGFISAWAPLKSLINSPMSFYQKGTSQKRKCLNFIFRLPNSVLW